MLNLETVEVNYDWIDVQMVRPSRSTQADVRRAHERHPVHRSERRWPKAGLQGPKVHVRFCRLLRRAQEAWDLTPPEKVADQFREYLRRPGAV